MRTSVALACAALLAMAQVAQAANYCVSDLNGYAPSPRDGRQADTGDLKRLGVKASWQQDVLRFTSSAGVTYPLRRFNSGDDYNGWEGFTELRNNWLFIAGAQYSYAVRLARDRKGRWFSVDAVLFQGEEGKVTWLDGALDAVTGFTRGQMRRTGVSAKISYAWDEHRYVSRALRSVLLLKRGEIFRDGRMQPMPWSLDKGWYFVGEAEDWQVVFVRSPDMRLYTYDGLRLVPVNGGDIGSEIRALPPKAYPGAFAGHIRRADNGRYVYLLMSANFEILKQGNMYALKRIMLRPEPDLFNTEFIATSDGKDLLALTRAHVYRLSDMRVLYTTTAPGRQINTTGRDDISAYVESQRGIVFTTANGGTADADWHVIRNCS